MTRFAIRRVLGACWAVIGVLFAVTLILSLVPGDPARLMLSETATSAMIVAARHEMGLDQPVLVRFLRYAAGAVHGDLGRSFLTRRRVTQDLGHAFPLTLKLTAAGMLLTIAAGVPAGIFSALCPGTAMERAATLLSLLGLAMPSFWVGLVLIFEFGYVHPWFPTSGTSGLSSLVLPAATLAVSSIAILARIVKAGLTEALRDDYVRTARAKGASERCVVVHHALRNTLIPVITTIGLQAGLLLGGAAVTETVFSWPGMGRLMVGAVLQRDYPEVQGAVLAFAVAFVLVNLCVDVMYGFLDPRIRYD